MLFSKPLYPIGGTMSCSLRRYMVFYYLATLFVLSLDSNTSGLHVNLLAGWTYIGGAGQDSMIGCSISVVSISPLPSLRTWISLVWWRIGAIFLLWTSKSIQYEIVQGKTWLYQIVQCKTWQMLSGRDIFKPENKVGYMFTSCLIFVQTEMSAHCYLANKQSVRNFGWTAQENSIVTACSAIWK